MSYNQNFRKTPDTRRNLRARLRMPKIIRKRNYNFKSNEEKQRAANDSADSDPQIRRRKQRHPLKSVPQGNADTQPGIVFTLPHYMDSEYRGKLVRIISSPPHTSDASPILPIGKTVLEVDIRLTQSLEELTNIRPSRRITSLKVL